MKPHFNSLRLAVSGAIALTGACTLLCTARADTLGPYTASYGNVGMPYLNLPLTYDSFGNITNPSGYFWSTTLSLPQFDPSLGTLNSVTVKIDYTTTQQVQIKNNAPADQQTSYSSTPLVDLSVPGIAPLAISPYSGMATPPGTTVEFSSPPLVDGTPGSPVTIPAMTSVTVGAPLADAGSGTFNPGTFAYIGTGTVGIPASCDDNTVDTNAGGNIIFNNFFTASVTVTITYNYTPSNNTHIPGVATRTWGFWKTHLAIFNQVVNDDCINLGVLAVTPAQDPIITSEDLTAPDLGTLEAIFWTSPGSSTTPLGAARLALAHQLIAAQANVCIGTWPSDKGFSSTLISDAVAALDGTNIGSMNTLASQLDAFNTSGDPFSLPSPWVEGKADSKGSSGNATSTGPAFK